MVWISGILKFSRSKDLVERVAQLALKQRTELYEDSTLLPFFKAQMLEKASLYNRQIISSALLDLAVDPDVQASFLKSTDVQWQDRDLTSYKSAVTEFDAASFYYSAIKVDYSHGSSKIRFVSPLTDDNFDILLREIHLIP